MDTIILRLDAIIQSYMQTYYPNIELNQDFVYQEHLRILTAQDDLVDVYNGWATKRAIDLTLESIQISPAFRSLIQEKLNNLPEYPANIRGPIKAILTYPLQGFLPWSKIPQDAETQLLTMADTLMKGLKCELRMIEDRVYACIDNFNNLLFEEIDKQHPEWLDDIFQGVSCNRESSHITIVNSDVVCKLDRSILDQLIQEYNASNYSDILFSEVKHCIALDWPLFSIYYVIGIQSQQLKNFIASFNQKFGLKLNPSLHISFLTRSR